MKRHIGSELHPVESPSGKNASYENFPVGSLLLPRSARPHVGTFYSFARTIDDIADSPRLSATEKTHRLDGFAEAVTGEAEVAPGYETGLVMRKSLEATGVSPVHCLDLIKAFKQDAVQSRYETWDDLVSYCLLSAAPVGRYLIDLIEGSKQAYEASDNLCIALQVINHIQDCGDDYRELNRVYLPQSWMREYGVDDAALGTQSTVRSLQEVLLRCLHQTAALLDEAIVLPRRLHNRRLAMEASGILCIASALVEELSNRDVLESRVTLSKGRFAWCILRGLLSQSWR